MFRVIKSASYMGYKYRYEVHWMTPSSGDKLLGASNSLEAAERIALDNMDRIFESPWESDQNKLLYLQNCYIYDAETDSDVTTDAVVDKADALMSEINSRLQRK